MYKSFLSRIKFQTVFFKYLSSNILNSLVALFSGFFTFRYIAPDLLGIWALFSILELYATFTRLGVINGLGRELPYLMGKKEHSLAKEYASTALYYSLSSNFILILVIISLAYFDVIFFKNQYYFFTFIVVIFRLLFSSYTSYLSVTFRTSDNFNSLSNIKIIMTIVSLLSLILVILYGFYGYIVRHFILSFTEVLLLHLKRPLVLFPNFNRKHFLSLIKIGFPLFIVSYGSTFIETVPRLFLINYGTIKELGLFSPIIVIINMALIIPNAISSYMYPKMSFEFGQSNDKLKLWKIVKYTALISILSGFFMFISVYILSDYIDYFFPKYTLIVPYLKLSAVSLLFIGYKSAGLTYSVLKSWNFMFINLGLFFLISITSVFTLHIFIDDITLISVTSMIITYSLMFLVSIYLSYKVTHE